LAVANKQGSAFPRDQLARTWKVESEWVRASQVPPGVHDVDGWQDEYQLVQAYSGLKKPPPIEAVMDPDLVASLYRGGVLIWPGP